MLYRDSNEYRTVMDLYNKGRITAEERDRLLEALDADSDRDEAEQDKTCVDGENDELFSDDDTHGSGESEESEETAETAETEESEESAGYDFVDDMKDLGEEIASAVDSGVKKSMEDILADIGTGLSNLNGRAINNSVKKALGAVNDVLANIGVDLSNINEASVDSSVKMSLAAMKDRLAGMGIDLTADGTVMKKQRKDYGADFDVMDIEVKYCRANGSICKLYEKTRDVEKLKDKCRNVLDADSYTALCELAEERFTGDYKLIKDGNVLRISIAPPGHDDRHDGAVTLVNDSACGGATKKICLEKYDVPYTELIITARYVDDGGACVYSEKAADGEKLKAECKPHLSERCYEALCAAIDDKIVGKLQYSVGDEFLNVTVRPEKAAKP